jgi:3D (Asp-Asp-Asp) domain-containing protein
MNNNLVKEELLMNHKHKRHRTIDRVKKKFKGLAAAVAAATILSGAMLPGLPATAHAAADPNAGNTPTATSQQISNTDQSAKQKDQSTEKANPAKNPTEQNSKANTKQDKHSSDKADTKQDKQSSDKAPTNYKKVLDITATAYAPGPHDNDQWGDKTFTGTKVRPGIIAVDPDVIPLGSRVYIQYPDGHGEYVVAEDTGGAIKGNRIDIAKPTVHNAQDFGMKDVKVFVMDKVKT